MPYNTAKNFGREKRLHILRREEESRPGVDKHQAADDSPAIAEPFRHPAIDEKPDELPDIGTLERVHRLAVMLRSAEMGARGDGCRSGLQRRPYSKTYIAESCLPRSRDLPFPPWQLLAVFSVELRERI